MSSMGSQVTCPGSQGGIRVGVSQYFKFPLPAFLRCIFAHTCLSVCLSVLLSLAFSFSSLLILFLLRRSHVSSPCPSKGAYDTSFRQVTQGRVPTGPFSWEPSAFQNLLGSMEPVGQREGSACDRLRLELWFSGYELCAFGQVPQLLSEFWFSSCTNRNIQHYWLSEPRNSRCGTVLGVGCLVASLATTCKMPVTFLMPPGVV